MRARTAGNHGGQKIENIMKARDTSMLFRIKGERGSVKQKNRLMKW
jgi:hypothetical protein